MDWPATWDAVRALAPFAAAGVAVWAIRAGQRAQFDRERRTAEADLMEELAIAAGEMVRQSEHVARMIPRPVDDSYRLRHIEELDLHMHEVDKTLTRLRIRLRKDHPIVVWGQALHDAIDPIRMATMPEWSEDDADLRVDTAVAMRGGLRDGLDYLISLVNAQTDGRKLPSSKAVQLSDAQRHGQELEQATKDWFRIATGWDEPEPQQPEG